MYALWTAVMRLTKGPDRPQSQAANPSLRRDFSAAALGHGACSTTHASVLLPRELEGRNDEKALNPCLARRARCPRLWAGLSLRGAARRHGAPLLSRSARTRAGP